MAIEGLIFPKDTFLGKVFFLGNPAGYFLNDMMAGKPPKLAAQTLGALSSQTSKEGADRARVYGIARAIGGNVMYMSPPIKRMVKTYAGEAGGKGGKKKKKKQYQDVEHVYRYYAVDVCEGPITGFRRIWRNGALVYDARKGSAWGAKNNHLFFQTYRLYTGSWNQMQDPMLQARWGVNIPAHRGTAYLVADNEDLTQTGGAIPQWQFEVVRSEGYYLTSRPYVLEEGESGRADSAKVEVGMGSSYVDIVESDAASSGSIFDGVFRSTVIKFDNGIEETFASESSITGGEFREPLVLYSHSEEDEAKEGEISGGKLWEAVISYSPDVEESKAVDGSITWGEVRLGVKPLDYLEEGIANDAEITGGDYTTNNPTFSAPYNVTARRVAE